MCSVRLPSVSCPTRLVPPWPPACMKAFATRYANAILRFIGRYYDGVEAEWLSVLGTSASGRLAKKVYGSTFFESAEAGSWPVWAARFE